MADDFVQSEHLIKLAVIVMCPGIVVCALQSAILTSEFWGGKGAILFSGQGHKLSHTALFTPTILLAFSIHCDVYTHIYGLIKG